MSRTLKTRTQYVIIGSDYSAQEPRMTAQLSQDPNMLNAYIEGKDLYAVIAQSAFNNNYEDNLEFWPEGTELDIGGKKVIAGYKTHKNPGGKDRRDVGKVLQLAATYGMSGAAAGEKLKKTAEEGKALLDSFFTGFPKVKEAIDNSKEFLKKTGYVEDWAGRRRHLPDYFLPPYEAKYKDEAKSFEMSFNPLVSCPNRSALDKKLKQYIDAAANTRNNKEFDKLANEAYQEGVILTSNTGRIAQTERQCFNARIQGGAASLTKLAMVNVSKDKELLDCNANLIITVHDEMLVECPRFYSEQVTKRLPQVMVDASKPYMNVPMKCDPYCVERWYADEAGAEIVDEFTKLTEGDEDKGIEKIPKDQAYEIIYEKHSEIPKQTIDDVISGKEEQLIF